MLNDLLLVFAVALLLTLAFAFGLRRQRNRAVLFMFFLVLFFATWAGVLWLNPVEFPGWGQSWLPFLVIGLIFALLIAAFIPSSQPVLNPRESGQAGKPGGLRLNYLFLIVLIVLGLAIALFYV